MGNPEKSEATFLFLVVAQGFSAQGAVQVSGGSLVTWPAWLKPTARQGVSGNLPEQPVLGLYYSGNFPEYLHLRPSY